MKYERYIWLPIDGDMEEVYMRWDGNIWYLLIDKYHTYAMDKDFNKACDKLIYFAESYLGVFDDHSN